MKIVSILGTRPNFTKEFSINTQCKKYKIQEVLVHTGQHYDYEMSQTFFEELELPKPDYINSIIKGTPGYETATMLAFIEQVLLQENPDVTLVYGDVNSTIAGALASAKLKIPVAHIEAGLRSGFFYNPEELNRKATDVLSEYLFPHIKSAYNSLINENFPKDKIFLFGDVVKDSLLQIVDKLNIKITEGDYYLCTVHREENTENKERLANIIKALIESEKKIILPLHPRTLNKIKEFKLYQLITESKNIELLPPQGFISFIKLLAGCNKFLTDSGSARREAYILKKPVITLINIIWVKEMVECGWNKIVDSNKDKIINAIYNHQPKFKNMPEIFGDGFAAKKIIKKLIQLHYKS